MKKSTKEFTPKIIVKNFNIENEVKLFVRFLNHPYYPQHRNLILNAFKELRNLLTDDKKNDKKILTKFINEFYEENKKNIKPIFKKSNTIIDTKGRLALNTLAKIMNYKWEDKSIKYFAVPTILPFSPFENNVFYFSILGEIKGMKNKNILMIAMHEISHFIFYDQLKKIEQQKGQQLPVDAKNYIKESLTAFLLNQKAINKILKFTELYKGNPEIWGIKIQKGNEKPVELFNFIEDLYKLICVKNKKSFQIFLNVLIDKAFIISKEFSKKKKIWNRYGKKIYDTPRFSNLYSKAIKIKK